MIDLLNDNSVMRNNGPVPFFAYGTLRVGESLDRTWISNIRLNEETGYAHGFRLVVPNGGWFPYLVPDEKATTVGELTWVKPGAQLSRLVAMEVGAGYSLEIVNISVNSIMVDVPAFTFVWRHDVPSHWRQVRHNDWAARDMEVIF